MGNLNQYVRFCSLSTSGVCKLPVSQPISAMMISFHDSGTMAKYKLSFYLLIQLICSFFVDHGGCDVVGDGDDEIDVDGDAQSDVDGDGGDDVDFDGDVDDDSDNEHDDGDDDNDEDDDADAGGGFVWRL